ncbi:hypothetical protein [Hydrogenophaga sp.]|uniref:hypothetical protein n=1 Tax=Hydrogenophaga sp. TaxID=1904254 RepID=UPI00272054BF|nr:hypothetical protein [Hydrogenophaga sp.]MDO9437166.1 hypothetical protein [Hydrogenophaga sp.]
MHISADRLTGLSTPNPIEQRNMMFAQTLARLSTQSVGEHDDEVQTRLSPTRALFEAIANKQPNESVRLDRRR